MFAKPFRLTLGRQKILGQRFTSPTLSLVVSDNGLEHNRYACLVTKKVDKRAVIRNRIRRLVISELQAKHLQIHPRHDLFFMAKVTQQDEKQIQSDVSSLLEQAHLL